MKNPIVDEVYTISNDDDDIDKPIQKQTGIIRMWSSLMGLPRNPSTSETTGNDTKKTLTTPTEFELDGRTTPNPPKWIIIKDDEDKKPTTPAYAIIQYRYRWGHISFHKIKIIVLIYIISN